MDLFSHPQKYNKLLSTFLLTLSTWTKLQHWIKNAKLVKKMFCSILSSFILFSFFIFTFDRWMNQYLYWNNDFFSYFRYKNIFFSYFFAVVFWEWRRERTSLDRIETGWSGFFIRITLRSKPLFGSPDGASESDTESTTLMLHLKVGFVLKLFDKKYSNFN